MNAIELQGIALRLGGRDILNGITWSVRAGECAAILGPNGAGKSTLLSVIGGFTWPQEGRVAVLGEQYGRTNLIALRKRMGFAGASRLPQFHDDMTAIETVAAGIWGAIVPPPMAEPAAAEWESARDALRIVGLHSRADAEMARLSSGERMRVVLARAFVARPELLVLDEPTTSLDIAARAHFADALDRFHAEHPATTILLVTHHVEDLPAAVSAVLVLAEGVVVAAGDKSASLNSETISRAFGRRIDLFEENGRYWTRVPAE